MEWQIRDHRIKGELWKKDDLLNTVTLFSIITRELQYKSVLPENFILPHLHITMGMINEPMSYKGAIEEDEKQACDDYDNA